MKKPYYSLKDYFQEKHGSRVYKITLDAGLSCPNRGNGQKGCIYCDADGSGTGAAKKNISIKEQITQAKKYLKERYQAKKFYLYYQAFTNTNAPVDQLKDLYDQGLHYNQGDIVGLIIGTRPDCIDEEKIKLLASYTPVYDVWIEYGLQSIHEKTLAFIQRGHSKDDYLKAITLTNNYPLKITCHIIVGLPYETHEQIMQTIDFITKHNKIQAIKIHSLYIPKNSQLAEIYQQKKFRLMSMEEYIKTAADILEKLPGDLVIARLTGETRRENLLAPDWVLNKQKVIEGIKQELMKRHSFQGKEYKNQ